MKTLESFWRWAIFERPDRIEAKQLQTLSPVALQSFTLACQLIDQRAGIPEGAQVDRTPLRQQCRDLSLSICTGLVSMHEHIEADSLKPAPKPRPTTTWYRASNAPTAGLITEADRERMRKNVQDRLDELMAKPSPVLERIKQENDRMQAAAYADERVERDNAVYFCFACGKGHGHHEPCETIAANGARSVLALRCDECKRGGGQHFAGCGIAERLMATAQRGL